MKSRHLVCLFSLVTLATFFVLVSGQSNSLRSGSRPSALSDTQNPLIPTYGITPMASQVEAKFAKPALYNSGGGGGASVAIGDMNGDGIPDLVLANRCLSESDGDCLEAGGVVSVLFGNGNGTFQAAANYSSGGFEADAVAIADVNGDGIPDIVVANLCQDIDGCPDDFGAAGPGAVSVLLGNGDGTFQSAVSYGSGGWNSDSIAVADVNGDGIPDLIVGNACEGSACSNGYIGPGGVGVLLGNGDGTFQAAVVYDSGGWNAGSVAIADLNGDGRPDLVVANECQSLDQHGNCVAGGIVDVLLGKADGTFNAPAVYDAGGETAAFVAIADVNNDGHPDLIVTNPCLSSGCHSGVSVLLGNANGTFQSPISYNADGDDSNAVAIGDVNGDGHPDLIVTDFCQAGRTCGGGDGLVRVFLGNGDGTFQTPPQRYASGAVWTASVAVGDINGDGRPDLLVESLCGGTGCVNGTLSVFLNNTHFVSTTALASSANPSVVNQPVTFTATISSHLPIPNGESVTFFNGASKLGTGTTANGVATLTTSFPNAGEFAIKAQYSGDSFHKASSGAAKQVVNNDPALNPASSLIAASSAITASPAESAKANQPAYQHPCPSKTKWYEDDGGPYVTESFTLGASANMNEYCHNVYHTICSGEMLFYLYSDGVWNELGAGTSVGECAWQLTTSAFTAGNNRLKAIYTDDQDGFGSSSSLTTLNVQKWPTTTTLTSTPNPSSNGQDVTFTASAIPDPDSGLIPTGKMRFFNGTKPLGAVVVDSNGNATLITKRLPSGQDSITAEYLGDADNASSTSPPYIQVVNQAVVENAEGASQ